MRRHNFGYLVYRKIKYSYFHDRSPLVAAIKVTQRCNLHCIHCPWVNKITEDLSTNEWKKIIDRLYNMGCTAIYVEGGEPTLRQDIEELIDYIKFKNIRIVLFTNGTRTINKINTDAIWISIDGIEEHHDIARGKGTFQRILTTLSDNSEKNIFSMTTLSKLNVSKIEELCHILSKTSLKGLIFNYMYPYQGIEQEALSKEERIASASLLIKLKQKYPLIASSNTYLKMVGSKDKVCHPWMLTMVTADGKIKQGCTVEPVEKPDCNQCDMMCGLEASAGLDLRPDSVEFWSKNNFLPYVYYLKPWIIKLLNNE